jgi:hypothetical protein
VVGRPLSLGAIGISGADLFVWRFYHERSISCASTARRREDDTSDYARHVCLEAESLEEVVMTLLARGLKPFQAEIDATKRRELTDASDLTFGIGTVFVTDPEGNIVEFMQADHRRQPALDRQSSQITCSSAGRTRGQGSAAR